MVSPYNLAKCESMRHQKLGKVQLHHLSRVTWSWVESLGFQTSRSKDDRVFIFQDCCETDLRDAMSVVVKTVILGSVGPASPLICQRTGGNSLNSLQKTPPRLELGLLGN